MRGDEPSAAPRIMGGPEVNTPHPGRGAAEGSTTPVLLPVAAFLVNDDADAHELSCYLTTPNDVVPQLREVLAELLEGVAASLRQEAAELAAAEHQAAKGL